MNLIPRNSMFGLDNIWSDLFAPARMPEESGMGFFTPRVDIKEMKDSYEITADLPGVEKKDLNVTLENGVMTIEAETRHEEKKEKDGKLIHRERRYGKFVRSFNLDGDLKEQDIQAAFKDGVLTLKVPRKEKTQPVARRIEIH